MPAFVSYESREVHQFCEAIKAFSRNIPDLSKALHQAIHEQYE